MKLTELVTTAKGRKATAKLAWDLGKITGKVAVAGTAGLAATFIGKAAVDNVSGHDKDHVWSGPLDVEDGFHTFGPDGPGYYQGGYNLDNE
ncbi:hypothetical protein [Salinicola salarius]|uniref:hypothetical protein n=1 Tax=Salinicola salarius TaxID=430457 RepID=UPI000DA16FF5|nr:hypothetical protein [Salinicola salarius]